MKVEPFLLASTLRAVIAQRLVRRLCGACKSPADPTNGIATLLGFTPDTVVYRPVGCEQCGHTGFKGRIGVFEAVRIDSTMRQMINQGADEPDIARHVFARSSSLQTAVRDMVIAGLTTPEEAVRISRSEDSLSDA